jgi:hypothetical protein
VFSIVASALLAYERYVSVVEKGRLMIRHQFKIYKAPIRENNLLQKRLFPSKIANIISGKLMESR